MTNTVDTKTENTGWEEIFNNEEKLEDLKQQAAQAQIELNAEIRAQFGEDVIFLKD